TADGAQHMEYVRERGVFDDLPLDAILTVLRRAYGPKIFTGAHPLDEAFTGTPDRRTRPYENPGIETRRGGLDEHKR
ncbi:MAG: transglutaminase, partial [Rhodococcus sp. (in: high G+C Gram-positive bacteria)]|nr:transglutaminase [Rhodococcus sp. (in: high G+C Gram-positive bacteria)]